MKSIAIQVIGVMLGVGLMLFAPHGAPVDAAIAHLSPHLEPGDILIFLPGEKAIKDCSARIQALPGSRDFEILPLYARLAAEDGIADGAWVIGRSAPAFYYNMVGERDQDPAFAQALVEFQVAGGGVRAQAFVHFLARLERHHVLLGHIYPLASTRVTRFASRAFLDLKHAEVPIEPRVAARVVPPDNRVEGSLGVIVDCCLRGSFFGRFLIWSLCSELV